MRRREFIRLLGGTAAGPLAARAQSNRTWQIGYLSATESVCGTSRHLRLRSASLAFRAKRKFTNNADSPARQAAVLDAR
jgi:hypothetical protein